MATRLGSCDRFCGGTQGSAVALSTGASVRSAAHLVAREEVEADADDEETINGEVDCEPAVVRLLEELREAELPREGNGR